MVFDPIPQILPVHFFGSLPQPPTSPNVLPLYTSPPMRRAIGTGWRSPRGCLISCITFRKLATNYRALLRKMTYKDKASHDPTPPCTLYPSHLGVCEESRDHNTAPKKNFASKKTRATRKRAWKECPRPPAVVRLRRV